MPNPHHIIRKSTIDLQFNGSVDGFVLQKEVDTWCRQELVQLLDEALQPYAGVKDHVRIDTLEINVVAGDNEDWKTILAQDVRRQITEKLQGVYTGAAGAGIAYKNAGQSFTESLVFFLENGHLPWWSRVKSKDGFLEEWRQWLKDGMQDVQLVKRSLQNGYAQFRLAHLLPAHLFDAFIVVLNPSFKDVLPSLLNNQEQKTAGDATEDHNNIAVAFRLWLLQNRNRDASLLLRETAPLPLQNLGVINVSANQQTPGVQTNDDAIFISNAGLVILAAFLPVLWTRLNIVKEGKMIEPSTALGLLHYLVSGSDHVAEFELVLPKILCGIEVNEVITCPQSLSVAQKTEADNLLLSTIEHWSIVKNTSIEGLREAFLQREGMLSFQKDVWRLQVEQGAYDMLLQHIPWNINLVKLSWMKYMLRTEWV